MSDISTKSDAASETPSAAKTFVKNLLLPGARVYSRLTGKVPASVTWQTVWGNTSAYANNRWKARDEQFERRAFDYQDALDFLARSTRGSAKDIRNGSIPEKGLAVIAEHLPGLKRQRPMRGLHIGNFVGVSLAYLTDVMRRTDENAVMLSVDPAIPHRGIDAPHDLVTGLMTRYGLEANWLPVTGFSLNRGAVFDVLNDRSSHTRFSSYHGFSATQSLENLVKMQCKFDFALIDGNHNGAYLAREIETLMRLVRPGGLLFLDDVDENWDGVMRVFETLDTSVYERVALKNRVGIVRRRKAKRKKRKANRRASR